MKLGRRGVGVGEGLGFIASFPFCPPFPIEADAVVTRLALALTVITFWSFFSALDLPILAGPVIIMFSERLISCKLFAHLPTAIATTLLGLGTSWFLWSRHVNVEDSKTGS